MVECSRCGAQVVAGANFCSHCGGRLLDVPAPAGDSTRMIPVVNDPTTTLELAPADLAAVQALPADHALLLVERGPSAGSRFLLDGEVVTAGRHPDADIFLDDITVSRHHVKFQHTDGGWTLVDQNSLNGTYVNRSLVEGEVRLAQGDEVQIGKFRMVFFVSEPGLR